MKPFRAPRAVLLLPESAARAAVREVLALTELEAYEAERLSSVREMAQRQDTLMIVLDARGFAPPDVVETLQALRANPKSAHALIAVIAEDTAQAKALFAAGADTVECSPFGLAGAWRLLLKLVKKARPEGENGDEEPAAVWRDLVKRRRARHKIYLGAAPGVGKTYAMLREAHELQGRGLQVLVGVIETHGRADTAAQTAGLHVLPKRTLDYKGTQLEELDLDALLQRRPEVVLIDELAHTNMPGSLYAKRYEDVQLLLAAGIAVISTVNIQHLESLNNIIERLTGVKVRETIPDAVLEDADEVVLVDISPEALQERLKAGKIYGAHQIEASLGNFFTTHNLTALRELVLRELADTVDERLELERGDRGPALIQDRLLVCLTAQTAAQQVLRRASRLADRLNAATLVAFHVETRAPSALEAQALAQNLALAESLEAEIVTVSGDDVAEAIAQYAERHRITMILLGESRKSRWRQLFKKPIFEALLARTTNIDVVIVGSET